MSECNNKKRDNSTYREKASRCSSLSVKNNCRIESIFPTIQTQYEVASTGQEFCVSRGHQRVSNEWLLDRTMSWLTVKFIHLSRGQKNWNTCRKLRQCKSEESTQIDSTLLDTKPTSASNRSQQVFLRTKAKQLQSSPCSGASWTKFHRLSPLCIVFMIFLISNTSLILEGGQNSYMLFAPVGASLIIGDSAIEIQEVDPGGPKGDQNEQNRVSLGAANDIATNSMTPLLLQPEAQQQQLQLQQSQSVVGKRPGSAPMPSPLPPISGNSDDITDGDKKSRNHHDFEIHELNTNDRLADKDALSKVLSARPETSGSDDKTITGKVVDFELIPAGGHNKAKIKKKKKKKAKKEGEMFKKWNKKKKSEKKAMEKEHKEVMKKKKEEGEKKKKKWGQDIQGLKKKGKFKKKKWGKKIKKGKGLKKGKKGKKFLKDKGHKNTGFKTVYHKEEFGKSSKWHDIKREKKWNEESKKWKKKWKKEKGKKYKGDHMKKFEKKKKSGKKYKKENKDKFKKFKKEKFEKGKKKKKEEFGKKKEGGKKKEVKEKKKKKG